MTGSIITSLGVTLLFVISNFVNAEIVGSINNPIRYTHAAPSYNYLNHKLASSCLIKKIENMYSVTQCWRQCIKDVKCVAHGFNEKSSICELYNADHTSCQQEEVKDWKYYLRTGFQINEDNPCLKNPCQNNGICLDRRDEGATYECACNTAKFSGVHCETKVLEPEWTEWSDYGTCSATCGTGYQLRTRKCKNKVNGKELEVDVCEGSSSEAKECVSDACPLWSNWSIWSSCSSNLTCGKGVQTKTRHCQHGGKIGVDRGCMGMSEKKQPCVSVACNTPVRLFPNDVFGEGFVVVYNNIEKSDGFVCSDSFHLATGKVLCKSLGFGDVSEVVASSSAPKFQEANPLYMTSKITCKGTESSIQQCNHSGWSKSGYTCSQQKPAYIKCKVDGHYTQWNEWGTCSETCGDGQQTKARTCNNPQPLNNGKSCEDVAEKQKSCNLKPCPVDAVWKQWTTWSDCTKMCGNGTSTRTRECQAALNGGEECKGDNNQIKFCNTQPCPVDGTWTEFSAWTECTKSCDNGTQKRERTCEGTAHGGKYCPGDDEETRLCNPEHCPVHGGYTQWTAWTTCNVTCGGGLSVRSRTCTNPVPAYGGNDCTDISYENVACNIQPCPVDGKWVEWSPFTTCTVTCGGGNRTKTRTCDGPYHGGAECQGLNIFHERCNEQECPIDGNWVNWSSWTDCTVTCGGGIRNRTRTCTNPEPQFNGKDCPEHSEESQHCNQQKCPVDGYWEEWSQWSTCTKTCGTGTKTKTRNCVPPKFGGSHCIGEQLIQQNCSTNECPIHGAWTQWTSWTNCNETCGGGHRARSRSCTEPKPQFGGNSCQETPREEEVCNNHSCPVDGYFNPWSEWSDCSLTCAKGTSIRSRVCVPGVHGGHDCEGDKEETKECNEGPCPIDGKWSLWSEWGSCNASCAGGIRQRTRTCSNPEPKHGGKNCQNSSTDNENCNTQPCHVDGYITEWSKWSDCTATCGPRTKIRTRKCVEPMFAGKNCPDVELSETVECTLVNCPIDGNWTSWGNWTKCNVSCAGGIKQRFRTCASPKPQYNGNNCSGSSVDSENCNENPCPIDGIYSEWSEWDSSICASATCGSLNKTRNRICIEPQHGGNPCQGPSIDFSSCNIPPCPIPGLWLSWSSWSRCSDTCKGGFRTRIRECNMTSFGSLTADCLEESVDRGDCNSEFECKPVKTCMELYNRGITYNVNVFLDPDGDGPNAPFNVTCDMEGSTKNISSIVYNNITGKGVFVSGYEGQGSFRVPIHYSNGGDSMAIHELAMLSDGCKQFIKYTCHDAGIHFQNNLLSQVTFWVNYWGSPMTNHGWAGRPRMDECACASSPQGCGTVMTKSNINGEQVDTIADAKCNCDRNDRKDDVTDEGYLTNVEQLPVKEVRVGDTGNDDEYSWVFVGPLICWNFI